jgi:hypothetical protein
MSRIRDFVGERGVALPTAFIAMLILAALMLAFLSISSSEPQIASNHLSKAQARAQAEGGVERTVWALSNPTHSAGLADPLPFPRPAPFDGSTFVPLGAGGYTVTVANGGSANERTVTSTGWVPNNSSPRAKQAITATLTRLRDINKDLPCALCVQGALNAAGNTLVDARASGACPGLLPKVGTYTTGVTLGFGEGDRQVYGADGNDTPNQLTDLIQNAALATFNAFTFTDDELNTLKAMAQANNAYYQGTVSFGGPNALPSGVVFVDTTTGNNITPLTPTAEYADVTLTGGNASGWLIVNGSLTINGNVSYQGLVYVLDDIAYRGTGSGGVQGAMVALGEADVTSDTTGNARVTYDCDAVKNGNGTVPASWFVKPKSWREVEG